MKHFEDPDDWNRHRDRIIGLGERSVHKNYYPALRRNMAEVDKLMQAIDQTTVGIVICNREGVIEFANPAQCAMTGYPAIELVGQRPRLYRSDATPPEVYAGMWAALSAGQPWKGELLNHRKTGEVFWIRLSITPIRDDAGQVTHFVGINEDISERKAAEARQKLLLHELNHRVKNTLATVLAISAQTLRTADSPQAFVAAFEARLLSLSRTHNLLTAGHWQGASLSDVLRQEVAPYAHGDPSRFVQRGPAVHLGPVAAVTLGLAFHELAANAARYGALSGPSGQVRVGWQVERERWLRLDWQEAGGPPVQPPRRRGFGSALIQRSLGHELAGAVALDFPPEGVRCSMEMRLDRVCGH